MKFEKTEVWGFKHALRGMRNPMDSWDKSDSKYWLPNEFIDEKVCGNNVDWIPYHIGENDMNLAQKLIKAGNEHAKFMRMIHVQADVTAPLYLWKELDTYKVGTTANSCSTMHTLHKRDLTIDDFSHEHFWDKTNEVHGSIPGYLGKNSSDYLKDLLRYLNFIRTKFIETKDKAYWWQIIQLLPSSFNQMRTIDLDYETLFSIYHQRKNHKLDEWREFCKWIETLPYMKEFLGLDESNRNEETKE